MKAAFPLLRRAADPLRAAAADGGAFLATVTRMDGAFGFREGASGEARGLCGILKTASREWEGVACRALDIDPRWRDAAAAADAVAGLALTRGPLETGLGPAGAVALDAREEAAPSAGGAALPLAAGEVVVITGGARGVTAACARALARAARPTLVLLGRSPAPPAAEPEWLRGLSTEAEVKAAFLRRAGGSGAPAAALLREAEAAWREAAAAREIRATLRDLEAAGSRALYVEADGRDAAAVAAAFRRVRSEVGPVVGIVHGAGVLADATLDRKTAEQVDRVFDTKVAGLRSLMAAAERDDLRFLVLFSSSTARYGRVGQGDYAAANEALNGEARAEARRRPGCRVVSLDWGPWDGGMVTPALARVFAAEGVGLIPAEAGAGRMLAEIAAARPGEAVEAVVLAAPAAAAAPPAPAPAAAADLERAFSLEVDEERFPVLRSHRLDGRAVVPAALLLEWIGHGALHFHPGLAFHGMEEFRVLKGVTLEGGAPAAVRVLAGRASSRGGILAVPVEVRGGAAPRETLHARATVLLADRLPEAPPAAPTPSPAAAPWDPGTAYREVLFHGPALRGIEALEGVDAGVALLRSRAAPPPGQWIRRPLLGAWLADPL
ncbi:MAG: SDR family NAD(P)-dependent oxidoreductase, partial [Planctomycetes bacterium]|nr:SDR family NAD(P)-dependent oxidoreductase [Planctomycetota bacterium]